MKIAANPLGRINVAANVLLRIFEPRVHKHFSLDQCRLRDNPLPALSPQLHIAELSRTRVLFAAAVPRYPNLIRLQEKHRGVGEGQAEAGRGETFSILSIVKFALAQPLRIPLGAYGASRL